jgi:hypothetical protein
MSNENKFYFINKLPGDYPDTMIGSMTPSMFKWSRMEHLYNIMDSSYAAASDPTSSTKIIKSGMDEYTADEFLRSIAASRMWTFDIGL